MYRACAAALLAAFQAVAQQPQVASQQTASAPAGLETDWDIAVVLQEIGKHADRLLPALNRIDARAWVDLGASETYAEQLESCKDQVKVLAETARELARNPEQLASSISLFIRMESLGVTLLSLQEGIRKYQSGADAQALAEEDPYRSDGCLIKADTKIGDVVRAVREHLDMGALVNSAPAALPTELPEYRCVCGKLLFKGKLIFSTVEIKCKRCGEVRRIDTAEQEMLG